MNNYRLVLAIVVAWLSSQLLLFSQMIDRSDIKYSENHASINQINLRVTNRSLMSSKFPRQIVANDCDVGIIWPGGKTGYKSLIYTDGLVLAGKIKDEICALADYESYFYYQVQPGKMFDDGSFDNPNQNKYRVYRILKNWELLPYGKERDELEKDYNEWPVEDGAPWTDIDGDGIFSRGIDQPDFVGDEVLFYICNDADSSLKTWLPNHYSKSLGLEFQVTVFNFNRSGVLGNTVFRKYKIINKDNNPILDLFIGFYSFPVMGWCSTFIQNPYSAAGCDTTLNLGYDYCFTNLNLAYSIPPAIGYSILQGPIIKAADTDSALFNNRWKNGYKNLPMTSFTFFKNYTSAYDQELLQYKHPTNNREFYNSLSGLLYSGLPMKDPWTKKNTKFAVPGNPVSKEGWYDHAGWGNADSAGVLGEWINRELLLSSGPITMAPHDTQEVVIATMAAQGKDHFDSITQLKRNAAIINKAYFANFQLTPLPLSPNIHSLIGDECVTLWWDSKAEVYDEPDPYIFEQGFEDTTYTFEGYIIRQYSDSTGSNPRIIKIFDKTNGISVIEDYQIVNGVSVKVPVLFANDEGLVHYIKLSDDDFTSRPLLSGSEYYFSVSAYAFSFFSSPSIIESKRNILKVVPGRNKIDYSSQYETDDRLLLRPVTGLIDSKVEVKVIDPGSITDYEYHLNFWLRYNDKVNPVRYELINNSTGDTLINESKLLGTDSLNRPVNDGFMILITNSAQDSILKINPSAHSAIKSIDEIIDAGEVWSVMNCYNSTNRWKIKQRLPSTDIRADINLFDNVGIDTYEIIFTPSGSEYYTTGYAQITPLYKDDPKGKGKIPFEVWRISDYGLNKQRLMIKVWDKESKDSMWTKNAITNEWEKLYFYMPKIEYMEPLPISSGEVSVEKFIIGNFVIEGEMPEPGTIIRISTFRPIIDGDKFIIHLEKADFDNKEMAKTKIDEISVFPNPYFAGNNARGQDYIRFTGLPVKATIRIYSLAGVFIRKYEKEDMSQYIDWDLRNEYGEPAGSGIYIAYIEMPGIGNKILKLAVIQAKEYLDKL